MASGPLDALQSTGTTTSKPLSAKFRALLMATAPKECPQMMAVLMLRAFIFSIRWDLGVTWLAAPFCSHSPSFGLNPGAIIQHFCQFSAQPSGAPLGGRLY